MVVMNTNPNTTTPLDYNSRLQLAYTQCIKTFYDRGRFISDDDLLDAAEAWSTTDLDAVRNSPLDTVDCTDYTALIEDLYAAVFGAADDEGEDR